MQLAPQRDLNPQPRDSQSVVPSAFAVASEKPSMNRPQRQGCGKWRPPCPPKRSRRHRACSGHLWSCGERAGGQRSPEAV